MKFNLSLIFIFTFCLSLIAEPAFSQKFILLQKGSNQKTRLKYEIGEDFTYKSKDMAFYVTDKIVDIRTDIIVLTENVLQPSDIVAVDISKKDPRNSTLKNLGSLGMGAGGLFLLVSTVNSLYQEGDLSTVENSFGWPIGFFTAGFIISKIQYKEFKHKGRNKIQLVLLYGE